MPAHSAHELRRPVAGMLSNHAPSPPFAIELFLHEQYTGHRPATSSMHRPDRNPPPMPANSSANLAASSPTASDPAPAGLSSFALKIIAIVGMTMNHAAYIFYPYLPFEARCALFAVGGVTFPVMAFLLVEGYRFTSNIRKYAGRLLLFALISEVPYWLFLSHEGNVLFTLLLGLMALYLYDHLEQRAVFWLAFAALVAVSATCDWGILGVIMILMIRALPDRRKRVVYPILLPIAATGLPRLSLLMSTLDLVQVPFMLYAFMGCIAAIPLLLSYNGRRGRPLKYFFYAYYPAHILILGLAKGMVFGDWTLGY